MRIKTFMAQLRQRHPHDKQFLQAVQDAMESVLPWLEKNDELGEGLLYRFTEPDRILQFRITWVDQRNRIQNHRGWRVQYNNDIGPYKGGLRFHPDVSVDTFKFLGFEQTLKNALTGLPMGGAKGGSDFDPKQFDRGDRMRFCHAFMMELHKYLGPDHDIPAGDIGVGEREIGYLFDAYKQITGKFHGVLTGKNPAFGGSCIRKEATGYGVVYFIEAVLEHQNQTLEQQRCALSGAGNVAMYTAQKLLQRGAEVISFSDSQGCLHKAGGFSNDDWEQIRQHKEDQQLALSEISIQGAEYYAEAKPWTLECDIAIPCATENELDHNDAQKLADHGTAIICEAANMPLTAKARASCSDAGILILPSKAANIGGVAVSAMERTQNALSMSWSNEDIDQRLKLIMRDVHALCAQHGLHEDGIDYVRGSNIAAFKRVARAMQAYHDLG